MKNTKSILRPILGDINKKIKKHINEIHSFFSSPDSQTGIKIPSLPEKIAKFINGNVGNYVDKINKKSKTDLEYRKNLEDGIAVKGKKQKKWVFECFQKLFDDYKPPFARSIYRGLRITDSKKTSNFSLSDPDKKYEYEKFLESYEHVQGEGRHTLNSLLSDYMDKREKKSKWMLIEILLLPKSSISNQIQFINSNKLITLIIPESVIDILIDSNISEIIKNIQNLNDDNKSQIKELFEERRQYAFYFVKSGQNPDCKNIKKLLKCFSKEFYGMDDDQLKNKEIFLEILQVIQGICLFLKYFNGSLIVLLSREEHKESEDSCVGEFFILGINDRKIKTVRKFCKEILPIIDATQRYYFKKVLERFRKEVNSQVLQEVFPNPDVAKIITDIKHVSKKIYNFNSLAGVIRLSEIIRPSAIHEGKQQNYTFVIGYPYLIKDMLESISEFSEEPNPNQRKNENNSIKWYMPILKDSAKEDEEDPLRKAKARILGNSQIFQEKDVALFVDCSKGDFNSKHNYVECVCNNIVKPHPRGIYRDKTNIVDVVAEKNDVFVVQIIGQKKIEIFLKGKKIGVWSYINAKWGPEYTWDETSIENYIKGKLPIDGNNNAVKILSETIYQISRTPGCGASFVICQDLPKNIDILCPRMTIPFPKLGEGEITDGKKLLSVAIQDGGTFIDLKEKKFSGRRQWLPYRIKEPPFWYENFNIKKIERNEIYKEENKKKNIDSVVASNAIDPKDCQWRLYEICKAECLKKRANGREIFKNPHHWREWCKMLSWGTRHMSAMGMSACLWDKAVVVVVSADSTTTVFYKGIEARPSDHVK